MGDAYFNHREIDPVARRCQPGARLHQRMTEVSHSRRVHNQSRLRELASVSGQEVDVVLHDLADMGHAAS